VSDVAVDHHAERLRAAQIIAARRTAKPLHTVWSCGGGVDSTAIACLIVAGRLPRPDLAVMVDVGYERASTWRHVREVIQPRLAKVGVELVVLRAANYTDLALVDRRGFVVLPAHRRLQDGKVSKLHTHCNEAWKVAVTRRWLRAQGVQRAEQWLGIAADEAGRARTSRLQWMTLRHPLIELGLTRADCVYLLGQCGWPMPPRTSCWLCPNQTNAEWLRMAHEEPQEFAKACEAERQIQRTHPDVWLHHSCLPLAEWARRQMAPSPVQAPGGRGGEIVHPSPE
jgi:3'-phosphoadenosine 5'-phosphosulfate sulfotransferase (PAPS reductase)/FAD synthetase